VVPVDQTIPDRIPEGNSYRWNPQAKSGDHIWPYKDYPHLRLERSNVRLSHLFCNILAGNKNPPVQPQTKQWWKPNSRAGRAANPFLKRTHGGKGETAALAALYLASAWQAVAPKRQ
jgi:hypothetical protein